MTKPRRQTRETKRLADSIRAGHVFEQANPRLAKKVVEWAEGPVLCDACADEETADGLMQLSETLTAAAEAEDWEGVEKVATALAALSEKSKEMARVSIPWKERRGFIELAMRVGAERDVTRERLGLLPNALPAVRAETVNILNYTAGMTEEERAVVKRLVLNRIQDRVIEALPEPVAEPA